MRTIPLDENAIHESIKVLQSGGLVIFPSDTVYGALVDSTNKNAVAKLIGFKNRPIGKPISVFVSDFEMMNQYISLGKHQTLLEKLLPGPFTVILESKHKTEAQLESERGTLGVRIPDFFPVVQLVKAFGKPVTATSANLSGRPAHYSVETLLHEFPQSKKDMIDLIVDGGKLPRNKPSTVIDLTTPEIKIVRHGDVDIKDSQTFISKSSGETEKIAQFIIKKQLEKKSDRPLVFILEGDMGVGKTIFVKGAGKLFDIENITSPTYVISCEYKINKWGVEQLVHCDLFNIEESNEFKYLGLEEYIKPGNILFMEWGEKVGPLYDLLKSKGEIIHIGMKYINEKEREIRIW
ncbi:threonylcarbamoyl-AMP synthase [Candidatus Roizmanbacteria bacterium]|nr:threonylcarbamoyl-AMP synthase [Candidatus Roizmanbacteria bacterium]